MLDSSPKWRDPACATHLALVLVRHLRENARDTIKAHFQAIPADQHRSCFAQVTSSLPAEIDVPVVRALELSLSTQLKAEAGSAVNTETDHEQSGAAVTQPLS